MANYKEALKLIDKLSDEEFAKLFNLQTSQKFGITFLAEKHYLFVVLNFIT